MNWEVFITCAVTGAGDTTGKSERVPITPAAIAEAAIEAAKAGAAIAHIHVRDPETGRGSRDPRALPRGRGARALGGCRRRSSTSPRAWAAISCSAATRRRCRSTPAGTDLAGASERLAHVRELLPEICTLDCGSMNFAAGGDYVMTNTPAVLRAMARGVQALGVRPELEVFDTGHLVMVKELIGDGLIDDPVLIQLCTGIPYGAPSDITTLMAMVNQLPSGAIFSAFSIGRAAAAVRRDGRPRRRQRARRPRGQHLPLARRARRQRPAGRARGAILDAMNVRILGPDETRAKLGLMRR